MKTAINPIIRILDFSGFLLDIDWIKKDHPGIALYMLAVCVAILIVGVVFWSGAVCMSLQLIKSTVP